MDPCTDALLLGFSRAAAAVARAPLRGATTTCSAAGTRLVLRTRLVLQTAAAASAATARVRRQVASGAFPRVMRARLPPAVRAAISAVRVGGVATREFRLAVPSRPRLLAASTKARVAVSRVAATLKAVADTATKYAVSCPAVRARQVRLTRPTTAGVTIQLSGLTPGTVHM